MKCPLCQVEMRISKTWYKKTTTEPIKLYAVQEFECRNGNCKNYGKVVDEVKHELEVVEEETAEEQEEQRDEKVIYQSANEG